MSGKNAKKERILVIIGPTASGKSDLAVSLAKKLNGEIISADSRQVYRGLDIGTGKITKEEMQGVPHHLLDVADPKDRFTVSEWKKKAEKAIEEIISRGRLPIVCGGTGYYISALLDQAEFPEVQNAPEEQKVLESKTAPVLMAELKRMDARRAASMQSNGEATNKRRLARAIIIARALGKVPSNKPDTKTKVAYDAKIIGIKISDEELKKRIRSRLLKRLDLGMIAEAKGLHEHGLSYERMDELGLEYRYLAKYLKGDLNREELIETLSTKIWQYARRQKTWWKKIKELSGSRQQRIF